MHAQPLLSENIQTARSHKAASSLGLKLSLLLILFFSVINQSQSSEQQSIESLIKNLGKGGYVLYMRHAASDRSQTDTDTADLSNCKTQRNLSAAGREQASAIGKAIKTLNIPIGTVTTSPYCRCVDTAQLAFGRGVKSDDLRFTISADEAKTKQLSNALQKLLSTIPEDGTNAVIVAHTGNLKEAAKVWPKPEGVLHIFKPLGNKGLGDKGFEHVGRIAPNQWPQQ